MAKLKVSIVDQNTLRLEEAGSVGDIIDLKTLHSVDESVIIEQIELKRDEIYNQRFASLKQTYDANVQLKLNEQLNAFTETKNELIQARRDLESKLAHAIAQNKSEATNLETKLRLEFEIEKEKLTNQIKLIESQTKQTLENQFKTTINQKDQKIQALENDKEKILLSNQIERANELKALQDQLQEKQKDIDILTRERATRNIKNIGENLENWCHEQYKTVSLYGFKTSTLTKDNVVTRLDGEQKGTKGDYIFKVYNDTEQSILLTSAMVEMKSEALESEHKKKNADHYKKLHEDRQKKNLEYAILVSELEYNTESDAPIFSVAEYDKMYVVRPPFFITLLGIIESIGMKYAQIITEKENERIEFRESLEIISDFDKFKAEILENAFKHIQTQMDNINTKTATIIKSAEEIKESARIIVDSHLKTIKNKIESFSINKITNRINKIES